MMPIRNPLLMRLVIIIYIQVREYHLYLILRNESLFMSHTVPV